MDIEKKDSLQNIALLDDGDFMDNDIDPHDATLRYKTLTWPKATVLLLSVYICLPLMSFPWAFSILGLVPGILITAFITFITWYTGLTITEYSIANPGVTDVCDIGKRLFWNSNVIWWIAAACFVANNTIVAALHVLTGAKYFNTITQNYEGGVVNVCSLTFAAVATVLCFLLALPRTFSQLSYVAIFSAAMQFVSILLGMIFSGVQKHPNKYDGSPLEWDVWADPTSPMWPHPESPYPTAMTAVLNIVFTLSCQITYPSFIHQMKKPEDFKKAITVVSICEVILYVLVGSIMYVYVGNSYVTSPAYGSLVGNYLRISFSFALPTIIFLGSLYGNVTTQFLVGFFFSKGSKHLHHNTTLGWSVWIGLNATCWVIAFVISEVIPFFSDLEAIMSSLFGCWFGYVFWGAAYYTISIVRLISG